MSETREETCVGCARVEALHPSSHELGVGTERDFVVYSKNFTCSRHGLNADSVGRSANMA